MKDVSQALEKAGESCLRDRPGRARASAAARSRLGRQLERARRLDRDPSWLSGSGSACSISGRGTNMVALAEYKRREARAYDIALVASNVPEARGLVAARRLGIPTWAHSHKGMERAEFDRLLDAELRRHGVELVALAGYMRLLSPEFIRDWEGRILNIHPCLLPALQGPRHPSSGRCWPATCWTGCSVHLVTDELDDGPVLAQAKVRIRRAGRCRNACRAGARGGASALSARRSTPLRAKPAGRETRKCRRWPTLRRRSGGRGSGGDPAALDHARRDIGGDRGADLGPDLVEQLSASEARPRPSGPRRRSSEAARSQALVLKAERRGKRLALAALDPAQAIQSQTITFPSAARHRRRSRP